MNQLISQKRKLSKTYLIWVKGLAGFLLLMVTSAFQEKLEVINSSSNYLVHDKEDGKRLVTLQSEEFRAYSAKFHRQLKYDHGHDTISPKILSHALRGYLFLKHTEELASDQYLTIIDFTLFCNKKRLWVINMETKKVVFNELVAHGAQTGEEYAKSFSNKYGSNKSSLGFYTTGGTYFGSNNLSLKLNGLESKFNTNAFARGIVIHGASYVNDDLVNRKERIGRSFGCPAVSQKINTQLVNTIKGGTCLFMYSPIVDYLQNSDIMNANLYVTVDELGI